LLKSYNKDYFIEVSKQISFLTQEISDLIINELSSDLGAIIREKLGEGWLSGRKRVYKKMYRMFKSRSLCH